MPEAAFSGAGSLLLLPGGRAHGQRVSPDGADRAAGSKDAAGPGDAVEGVLVSIPLHVAVSRQ